MAGSLVLFVAINVYSVWFDARVTHDPELLREDVEAKKAARRQRENAILLRQRERWLQLQAELAQEALKEKEEGGVSAHGEPAEAGEEQDAAAESR